MTQWLRALAVLVENPGSVPSIHMRAVCNYSSRGSHAPFWFPQALHADENIRIHKLVFSI